MKSRYQSLVLFATLTWPNCWPADHALLSLPAPKKEGHVSVEAALATRRSVRAYTKQAMTIAELWQLLWAAQGDYFLRWETDSTFCNAPLSA